MLAMPSISRMRLSTRSKASRLSARSSATMSQRPLVVCSALHGRDRRAGRRSTASAAVAFDGHRHQRADAVPLGLGLQAHGVADDRAVGLELGACGSAPCRARRARPWRGGDRGAGVVAQQAKQLAVDVVHCDAILLAKRQSSADYLLKHCMNLINLLVFSIGATALRTMEINMQDTGSPIMVDYIGIESIHAARAPARRRPPSSKAWPARSSPTTGAGPSSTSRPASPATRAVGVIELMPTTDGHQYSFKYVNGHPKQHRARPARR